MPPTRWRITAAPTLPIDPIPFSGPILRSALGLAARTLACTENCRNHPCRNPEYCLFELCFEGNNQTPFRLDSTSLDNRFLRQGEPWQLDLTAFRPESEFLVDACLLALQNGLGRERIAHQPISVQELPIDIGARMDDFLQPILLVLKSPTEITRQGRYLPKPTPMDILHAIRHRLHRTDWELAMPRFEDTIHATEISLEAQSLVRWSSRQRKQIELKGVQGAWEIEPTPAQACWLALGEVLGVGKGLAMGKGVMACIV